MVNTAVILAAGMGTRLGSHTQDKPKAFLEVGGTSLIQRSLDNLKKTGIKNVLIGTGYKKEFFEKISNTFSSLSFIHNPIFSETSSMHTLYLMRKAIAGEFLLLESDLLYSPDMLELAINETSRSVVVSSRSLDNSDEVYLEVNSSGFYCNVSKNKSELKSIHSILTGISKLSLNTYKMMCEDYESNLEQNKKIDYEKTLSHVGEKAQVILKTCQDIPWCEIDDESHLQYAIANILPRL